MYSVLLQEEDVQAAADESLSIPVDIEVQVADGKTLFAPFSADDYTIDPEKITLVGSGGSPREFRLTFTLSALSIAAGYRLMNPALKFFQGGSTKAGFRVPPATEDSAQVALFNTLASGDQPVQDNFSILVVHQVTRERIVHDPTILWEPPIT
jgi:hypothetical protein